ncbi:hypothetical protein SAMN05428963_12022 [Consotaella salsifontis]|uniref:DUF2062 domain-containing protein n=2 Tax=Consotaella salsifontis TaxID=1365950 RepID=A0A1T4T6C3_9HYPH|nr:hypothetical protein SAMN05428963_12022 [Consotaella salsifontis]
MWPRRSWQRSFSYFKKRVLRLNATPHAIAAGFAAGVFASFTPFIGFHFVMSFVIAYLLAGNLAAAALGTVIGNPVTFPAIWASTYEIGRLVLAPDILSRAPENFGHLLRHLDFFALWQPLLKPMLIGAFIEGGVVALIAYGIVYWAVRRFRRHRARRILARRGGVANIAALDPDPAP